MDQLIRRSTYVTKIQKRKLIQLVTAHPDLRGCKFSPNFGVSDSQRLWQSIALECNALPGARKAWKQWRKTFQDLKSKYKKRSRERNGELPQIALTLNRAERETLGIKQSPRSDSRLDTEFVNIEVSSEMLQNMEEEEPQEPKFPKEERILRKALSEPTKKKVLRYSQASQPKRDCNECMLNCNLLSFQEEQKIKMKEDYYNFKKSYLRRKLKLMEEQTEALKSIARDLTSEITS